MKPSSSADQIRAECASLEYLLEVFERAQLDPNRFYVDFAELTDCLLDFQHPFISLNPDFINHPQNLLLDMLCLPKLCGTLRVPKLRGMFNRPKGRNRLSLRQHRLMVIAYLQECRYNSNYHVYDTPLSEKKILERYRDLNQARDLPVTFRFSWDSRFDDRLELILGFFSLHTRIIWCPSALFSSPHSLLAVRGILLLQKMLSLQKYYSLIINLC